MTCFFKRTADQMLVFDWIAKPKIKNQLNKFFFLYANVFHCFCFGYFEIIQLIYRKHHFKVTKLKLKFRALNNKAQELPFQPWLNLNIIPFLLFV